MLNYQRIHQVILGSFAFSPLWWHHGFCRCKRCWYPLIFLDCWLFISPFILVISSFTKVAQNPLVDNHPKPQTNVDLGAYTWVQSQLPISRHSHIKPSPASLPLPLSTKEHFESPPSHQHWWRTENAFSPWSWRQTMGIWWDMLLDM
jgi:hypothetical protein